MIARWHHVRTRDGWEIRDESDTLIAIVPDAQHVHEDDAIRIANAPVTDDLARRVFRDRDILVEGVRPKSERDADARWLAGEQIDAKVATLRADVVRQLASWLRDGYDRPQRAPRFWSQLDELGRRVGLDRDALMEELRAEAQRVIDEEKRS